MLITRQSPFNKQENSIQCDNNLEPEAIFFVYTKSELDKGDFFGYIMGHEVQGSRSFQGISHD